MSFFKYLFISILFFAVYIFCNYIIVIGSLGDHLYMIFVLYIVSTWYAIYEQDISIYYSMGTVSLIFLIYQIIIWGSMSFSISASIFTICITSVLYIYLLHRNINNHKYISLYSISTYNISIRSWCISIILALFLLQNTSLLSCEYIKTRMTRRSGSEIWINKNIGEIIGQPFDAPYQVSIYEANPNNIDLARLVNIYTSGGQIISNNTGSIDINTNTNISTGSTIISTNASLMANISTNDNISDSNDILQNIFVHQSAEDKAYVDNFKDYSNTSGSQTIMSYLYRFQNDILRKISNDNTIINQNICTYTLGYIQQNIHKGEFFFVSLVILSLLLLALSKISLYILALLNTGLMQLLLNIELRHIYQDTEEVEHIL